MAVYDRLKQTDQMILSRISSELDWTLRQAELSLNPRSKVNKFEELKAIIAMLEDDVYKCYFRLNGAAGKRVRKKMQLIKALSQDIRKEILLVGKNKKTSQF